MLGSVAEDPRRSKGTIEMDVEGPAPAGVLTGEDGLRHPFTGWTELATAIERWREAAGSRPQPEPLDSN
jgi:hypothetical protein